MKTISITSVLLFLVFVIADSALAQRGGEIADPRVVAEGESAGDTSSGKRDPHTGTTIIPNPASNAGAPDSPLPTGIGERDSGQTQRTDRSAGQKQSSSDNIHGSSERARSEMATQSEGAHLPKGLIGVSLHVAAKRMGDPTLLFIARVHPQGPAHRAGIQHGDEVVSVNGETVTGKTYEQVLQMMRGEAGTELKLGIKREEEVRELSITRIAGDKL